VHSKLYIWPKAFEGFIKEVNSKKKIQKMEKEPYIKVRTLLGTPATEIHEDLTTVFGAQSISYSTVQKWSKFFRDGNIEIEDQPDP